MQQYMYLSRKKNGFTLVELLVVIAIIGILSTLVMTNFIGVRQRARDAQRKADMRQIQSALEIYRADTGTYPSTAANGPYWLNGTVCPTSSSLSQGNNTYMQTIPCDPSGASVYNGGNYYYYSSGSTYTLAACIENTGDTDSHVTTTAVNPLPTTNSTCGSGYYFVLQNP